MRRAFARSAIAYSEGEECIGFIDNEGGRMLQDCKVLWQVRIYASSQPVLAVK